MAVATPPTQKLVVADATPWLYGERGHLLEHRILGRELLEEDRVLAALVYHPVCADNSDSDGPPDQEGGFHSSTCNDSMTLAGRCGHALFSPRFDPR